MWTCSACGEKEPLVFQMGHIRNCKKWHKKEIVVKPFEDIGPSILPPVSSTIYDEDDLNF